MKGELEELGEDTDENVENLSKMQGQVLNLTHGHTNIFDANGDFKSTYDILNSISEVWDDITDTDRAELLETVAGKHRANDIASLLQNWENVKKMKDSALNSDGSAAAEQEKYMQSMQGHLDQLTASWQAFSTSAMDSGFLNGFIDAGRGAIEVLTKLVDTFGLLPTIAGVASGALSLKGMGFVTLEKDIDSVIPKIKLFGQNVSDIPKFAAKLKNSFGKGLNLKESLASAFGVGGYEGKNSIFSKYKSDMSKNLAAFKDFNSALRAGTLPTMELVNSCFKDASKSAKEFATNALKTKDLTKEFLNWNDFDAQSKNSFIGQLANDHSISAILQSIDAFNDSYEKLGMTQKQVAQSFKDSGNLERGSYFEKIAKKNEEIEKASKAAKESGSVLVDAKPATAGITGYIASLTAAKVATIGLQVASMALNAALTMGIGLLVSSAIEGLMSLANRAQEVAEKADEAKSAFSEQKQTLSETKSTIDDVSSSYEKLSNGVDLATNKNVNLNTDDYKEYLSIVNQIAEKFPSLVKGYDSQGNAILSCAGNVKELNDAYNQQQREANTDFLKSAKDVAEDSKNVAKELKSGKQAGDLTKEAYEKLKDLSKSNDIAASIKALNDSQKFQIRDAINKSGFAQNSGEVMDDYIARAMRENKNGVQAILKDYESQMNEAASGMKDIADATIGNALLGEYSDMSDSMKTMIQNMTSGMDFDFFDSDKIGWDSNKLNEYINNMMKSIDSLGDGEKKSIEVFFDIQSKVDKGDATVGEYINSISDVEKAISGLDEDTQYQIKMSMGIENNDFIKQYDDFREKLTKSHGLSDDVAKSITDGLSKEEFQAFVELEAEGKINFDNVSTDSIKKQLEDRVALNKALNFNLDVDAETESLGKLNDAMAQSRAATGLTTESIESIKSRYKDLEGYNPAALFEKTTTGVRLNADALKSLEKQYVATNKAASEQKISALAQKYKEIEALRDSVGKDTTEYKGYQAQLDDLNKQIESAQLAAAAYDGLTSSYNNWLNAQSAGQAGDMYDQIMQGRDAVKTLAEESKWGNTELQSYIEMFSAPGSLDNATPEQYAEVWGSAIKKSNRYFQEGKTGIDNFISDVASANGDLVKMNKDGVWEITPGFEVEDWAKAAGVAESTVESIFGQMEEYGFDVPIGVEESSIDDLISKSEAASNALKSTMGEDFEIKVNTDITSAEQATSEIENLKAQRDEINNSSATVEVKEQGVEAVNSAIEAAINKKIELEQPAYMQIDASQVKSTMTDALSALQNYQNAVNEVTKLEGLQSAGIEIDTSQLDAAKSKVDETAEAIAKLDGNVKMAIGLDASDGVDAIKQKIESGEVKLTVDTDVNESATEQLAENVEKIQDKDVTITVKVDGLDDVKDLTKSIELATSIDGNVDGLSKFAEAAKELDGVSDDVTKSVTANLNGNLGLNGNLDGLDKFAEGAKKLEGVDSSFVTVNANFNGNLNENSGNIDNIAKFAEGAKSLEGVPSSNVTVEANLKGDGVGNDWLGNNSTLDNIKKFAEAAESLNGVGDASVTIKANLKGDGVGNSIFGNNSTLDNLEKFAESAEKLRGVADASVTIDANLKGNGVGDNIFGSNSTLDNLEKFAEGAEKLRGVNDVSVTVDANLKGNGVGNGIFGDNSTLDNIEKFADGAKKLDGIEDASVTIDANLNGNIGNSIFGSNSTLDNIEKFAEGAEKLKNVEDVGVTIEANLKGEGVGDNIFGSNSTLDNLDKFADSANKLKDVGDASVTIEANLKGDGVGDNIFGSNSTLDNLDKFAESAKKLDGVGSVSSDISVSLSGDGVGNDIFGSNSTLDNLDKFAESAKKLKDVEDVNVNIAAGLKGDGVGNDIFGNNSTLDNLDKFADAANKLKDVGDASVSVEANLDGNIGGTFGFNSAVDNLEKFADGAKKLDGVGDVKANVEANLTGEGVGGAFGFNSTLDNLGKFAEGAQKLKGVGDVSANVEANLKGTGIGNNGFGSNSTLDNLGKFAEGAEKLKGVGSVEASVTADLNGNIGGTLGYNSALDNLGKFADGAEKLNGINSKTVDLTANLNGNLSDNSSAVNNLQSFASAAGNLQGVESKTVEVTSNINGNINPTNVITLSQFGAVVSSLPNSAINISVNVNADTGAISNVKSTLESLNGVFHDYSANISAEINVTPIPTATELGQVFHGTASVDVTPQNTNLGNSFTGSGKAAMEPDKWDFGGGFTGSGTVSMSPSSYDMGSGFTGSGTVTMKVKVEGVGGVDGTAHALGTAFSGRSAFASGTTGKAFAQGNWGAKETGTALMGELGEELIVRNGRWFTVGEDSAGFYSYRKGDIVFNAEQTKEIFEKGKITHGNGRGQALAEGTAFATIGGGSWKPSASKSSSFSSSSSSSKKKSSSSSSKSSSSKSSSSGSSDEADKFEEQIDWIEIAIDRIERAISRLDLKATSVFKGWTERTSALNDQISQTTKEISLQESAYNRYMQEANKVGLSENYASKVRDGTIDIETITDEDLNDKISDYKEW